MVNNQILVERQNSGGVYYYTRVNQLVCRTERTDTNIVVGNVPNNLKQVFYQYDVYGQVMHTEGESTTPFLYNGRDGVMTDGNGLLYMRARYYSPELKRFVNADVLMGNIVIPIP